MCDTCGCAAGDVLLTVPTEHPHPADHDHDHQHEGHTHTVVLEQRLLARNDQLAEQNRAWLTERGILAVNLMSSPGSGKTTLLERTIRELDGVVPVAVVEGDQETLLDARRIQRAGGQVVQVNTGTGCHLDAAMVAGALDRLAPPEHSVVLIENVGNLVCPALFDLGEHTRVVLASVTEGADKPLKYPHMFRAADLVLLTKVDLLPHVDFAVEEFVGYVNTIRPGTDVRPISTTQGDGFADWLAWLRDRRHDDH